MNVYCIIVTYNGMRWIDKCLQSLRSSTYSLQVIIIDNLSSDGTVAYIRQNFPEVIIIETGKNLGFGKANNIGFKKALAERADYVFLLNQDAFVATNTVEILVEVASKNKDYGIISPFHLLPGGTKIEWYFSTYISPEKCKDLISDIYFNTTKNIYSLEFVNAAAWFISVESILQVGGFDPIFPHYGEDDDYCNRMLFKKFKIGVTPATIIIHDISLKSWEEIKANFQRQLIFCFIELKNIRYPYGHVLLGYIQSRIGKLFSLLLFGRWKEFFFMAKVFLASCTYFIKIYNSRKISKQSFSFLN